MRIKELREQIARMTPNNETPNSREIRALVVALVDDALEAEVVDEAALLAMCAEAMDARYHDRPWLPTFPARVADKAPQTLSEAIEANKPAPKVEAPVAISERTGKPKRKYTRRKKTARKAGE